MLKKHSSFNDTSLTYLCCPSLSVSAFPSLPPILFSILQWLTILCLVDQQQRSLFAYVCVGVCEQVHILIKALSAGPPLILIKEQMHHPCPVCCPLLYVHVCAHARLSYFDPACPHHVPLLSHGLPKTVGAIHVEDKLVGRRDKGKIYTQPAIQIG